MFVLAHSSLLFSYILCILSLLTAWWWSSPISSSRYFLCSKLFILLLKIYAVLSWSWNYIFIFLFDLYFVVLTHDENKFDINLYLISSISSSDACKIFNHCDTFFISFDCWCREQCIFYWVICIFLISHHPWYKQKIIPIALIKDIQYRTFWVCR